MKYEIGSRIRMYRKESGLTQEQLADKIRYQEQSFKLGTGDQPPRCGYLSRYLPRTECAAQQSFGCTFVGGRFKRQGKKGHTGVPEQNRGTAGG